MTRPAATPALALLLAAVLGAAASPAAAQAAADLQRGALLYETHCIACHTTQMHWRDNRVARDWDGVRAQVRRWQGNNSLGWSDADIEAVARHLNQRYYRYKLPVTAG